MRQTFVLSIVFILGVTSIRAFADDVYKPQFVPPCKMYKTANGVDVCGYDSIDDWKKVLVVDLEVGHVRDQLKNERERSANILQQKDLLQSEVDNYSSSQKLLADHEAKLTQDLIDLDKKYQDERVKPRWGSPIAWTLAVVSTSVLAGFVVYGLVH